MNRFELPDMLIQKFREDSDYLYEFHIAKEQRRKYELDETLFASNGNVVLINYEHVRKFVTKINSKRNINEHVFYGEVNAIGLLDEIFHFILNEYQQSENPGVMGRAIEHLNGIFGEKKVNMLMNDFLTVFPPTSVYKGRMTNYQYLKGVTGTRVNNELTLEEMLLLHFSNINPANKRLRELFDEQYLKNRELFAKMMKELDSFFQEELPFGPDSQDIFTFLKTPLLFSPDNLEDQLDYIMKNWKLVILDLYERRILSSKDLMREDAVFFNFEGGVGAPPTVAPVYKGKVDNADNLVLGKSLYKYAEDAEKDYEEPEQFTEDIEWMPNVVLMAKNIYVWLDQLTKKYGREINRLDHIPDEELDLLARWNYNSLWLIGVWERSYASKRIKHIRGNIDAVASAYSLFDYVIAYDLGGEEAYNNLNERCKKRGIRLASDMVPNHTGIFSKWVTEFPDYFIQSDHPPFPGYTFTGENLSPDPNYQIRIEDGYLNNSDAAVVFQRIDNRSGKITYMYHGNDGTNMPWNDTAQLDLLKPEVREALIQKIFEVARKFSVIRFDAAMTLTKRHFSRLWYPRPGKGGDIPSRADYSMSEKEFDSRYPVEFWREVVDRINAEMPETLLLAEAFWLMEGYFVRSLGMHRVYNSAFMNMMMKEENDKYRDLISNTLEFEPEILKRYVNFMSNPDEETAIKQFGTDDKYFGVCMLMVTLPGLPMFAHGQIEGYTEKYGMEYKRAYYNETPKEWLVERHEREIFPLTRKRALFSNVVNFWFFDFVDSYGNVNENVFAYANVFNGERSLVIYNNKYSTAHGWITRSTGKLVNNRGHKQLETRSIAEALQLNTSYGHFYACREHVSGKEFLFRASDIGEHGMQEYMEAFKYKIYLDFREMYDSDGKINELYTRLNGEGVDSVQRSLERMLLEDVYTSFRNVFDDNALEQFVAEYVPDFAYEKESKNNIKFLNNKYVQFLNTVKHHFNLDVELNKAAEHFEFKSSTVKKLNKILFDYYKPNEGVRFGKLNKYITLSREANYHDNSLVYLIWISLSSLKYVFGEETWEKKDYITLLHLDEIVKEILLKLGKGEGQVFHDVTLLNILSSYESEICDYEEDSLLKLNDLDEDISKFLVERRGKLVSKLLDDEYIKAYIGVNYYEGVWYYSKEKLEELIDWIFTLTVLGMIEKESEKPEDNNAKPNGNTKLSVKILKIFYIVFYLKELSVQSGYNFEVLKEKLVKPVKQIKEKKKKK